MCKIRPHQSAHEVHSALKSALETLEKSQQSAVRWFGEILDRKLYRELGFSSINQYAEVELGFSPTRTNDFIMLCRKLKTLPKVKEKIDSGELGYTAARVIAPIANQTNEAEWVDFALNNSRRQSEQEVKRAKRAAADQAAGQLPLIPVPPQRTVAAPPVRVSLEMTPTQFARYEKLCEQIRQQGGAPADKIEVLLETLAAGISPRGEKSPATKPPAQIHIHQCQSPGCHHTQYLGIHHIVPRSAGGSNDPFNLVCLCSACHKLLHDSQQPGCVKSPAATYNWCAKPEGQESLQSDDAVGAAAPGIIVKQCQGIWLPPLTGM